MGALGTRLIMLSAGFLAENERNLVVFDAGDEKYSVFAAKSASYLDFCCFKSIGHIGYPTGLSVFLKDGMGIV